MSLGHRTASHYLKIEQTLHEMGLTMTTFKYSVLCALILWAGAVHAAESDTPEVKEIKQTIKLYQGVLSFPPPMWVKEVKDLGNSQFYRDQQRNLFTLEQIPKDQEFEKWTNLYGVYGFHLPEYDMKRFVDESLNALALGCKVQAKSKIVSAQDGKIIMTFFCTDLRDPLVVDGYNTETGFLFMSQVDQSFAKVYMAWRSKQEYRNTDKWPMNKETVTEVIDRMMKIQYFKAE